MSYTNPTATEISSIGLDAEITKIQILLKTLPWLNECFHRAYIHREINGNKISIIPKVWESSNEWYDCRPNDAVISQAFFVSESEERVTSFEKHADPTFEQDISIIFWLNTDELASHISGPSLGYQKVDVLDILKTSDSVLNISSIIDRSAQEVFSGFTIEDQNTHYTMLPYAGFRINFTVKFDYIECLTVSS
jgi:hypothetical protein